VGRFSHGAVLERIVRAANDLQPDLTVMTGDLINFAMRDLPAGIDLARGLKARHGVYLCEGNHDLFEDPAGFRRQVIRSGLALLREEAAIIDVNGTKLQLVGVPWTHSDGEHERAARAAAGLQRGDAFPILLAHHPHVFDFAHEFRVVLAGHTHGGQLMLSEDVGFGPWIFRYWSGLYRRGDRSLVVSNGVGNWFPIRVGAPAEIVHLTLQSA
jgi:predicted MPP superfamily phosphohydrolase